MSTTFDIGCRTCRKKSGVVHPRGAFVTGIDELRSADDLHAVAAEAHAFATLGALLKKVYIRNTGNWYPLERFAQFFAEHPAHEFLVQDEYGYEWPTVQAYDAKGEKMGPPRAMRLELTKPTYSATITNVSPPKE